MNTNFCGWPRSILAARRWLRSASLLGLLAAALSCQTARAGTSIDVRVGVDKLVPVPTDGIRVDLWSDPPAGSVVYPGSRASLFFRTDADCYVTLVSIDTEGRVRLLFPAYPGDGWAPAGRTFQVPAPHAGYQLAFSGPPGQEFVYALASLYPVNDRYPEWLVDGRVWDPEDWSDEDDPDPFVTGWVVGDPFYRMRVFCQDLVPYPEWTNSYASAYVYFQVGRQVSYPRYLCSDCHFGGWLDPYGPACPAVQVRFAGIRCNGWIDFRTVFVPCYTYHVSSHWRPHGWHGRRWNGPDGRWVWSSADGPTHLRRNFVDARAQKPGRGDGRDWSGHRAPGRPESPNPQVRRPDVQRPDVQRPDVRRPDGRRPDVRRPPARQPDVRKPVVPNREPQQRDQVSPWRRAHEERLESTIRAARPAKQPEKAPNAQRRDREKPQKPENPQKPQKPQKPATATEKKPERRR